jgi:thioredoxin-like negative regulator of GroEL
MPLPLPNNFNATAPGPAAAIFVMVDWCGHCASLKPALPSFERALGRQARVYVVDGDASPDRVHEFRVEGFPTIMYKTTSGKLWRYDGPRDPESFAMFATRANASR